MIDIDGKICGMTPVLLEGRPEFHDSSEQLMQKMLAPTAQGIKIRVNALYAVRFVNKSTRDFR